MNINHDIFRTIIKPEKNPQQFGYRDNLFFIGSCFAQEIGDKLTEQKFSSLVNPFGVLYNPYSILENIGMVIRNQQIKEEDFFFHNERWQGFSFHGSVSAPVLTALLLRVQNEIQAAHHFLKNTRFMFITLGTAWVFRENQGNRIVANCHKLPQANFTRELLSLSMLHDILWQTVSELNQFCTQVNIIFTVSPIRHWRDGAIGNQRSKALLITALHDIGEQFPNVSYFPAYEIMMDDLRDYRFYESDMFHPNPTAIEYIRNRFLDSYLEKSQWSIMGKIKKIQNSMNHKPFNPKSSAHRDFAQKQLEQIHLLMQEAPYLDLAAEITYFNRIIN